MQKFINIKLELTYCIFYPNTWLFPVELSQFLSYIATYIQTLIVDSPSRALHYWLSVQTYELILVQFNRGLLTSFVLRYIL